MSFPEAGAIGIRAHEKKQERRPFSGARYAVQRGEQRAVEEGRVVVSADTDFGALPAAQEAGRERELRITPPEAGLCPATWPRNGGCLNADAWAAAASEAAAAQAARHRGPA